MLTIFVPFCRRGSYANERAENYHTGLHELLKASEERCTHLGFAASWVLFLFRHLLNPKPKWFVAPLRGQGCPKLLKSLKSEVLEHPELPRTSEAWVEFWIILDSCLSICMRHQCSQPLQLWDFPCWPALPPFVHRLLLCCCNYLDCTDDVGLSH